MNETINDPNNAIKNDEGIYSYVGDFYSLRAVVSAHMGHQSEVNKTFSISITSLVSGLNSQDVLIWIEPSHTLT